MVRPETLLRNGYRCSSCGRFCEDARACQRCGAVFCPECDRHLGMNNLCTCCLTIIQEQSRRLTKALMPPKKYLAE
jgi:hypothetical protein